MFYVIIFIVLGPKIINSYGDFWYSCKKLLINYFENSSNSSFYIRGINLNQFTNPTNIHIPIPNIVVSNEDLEPPAPSYTTEDETGTADDNFDVEMQIIETSQELEIESMSSDESELDNFEYSAVLSNPFESSFSFPRTPPNNNDNRSNTQSPSPSPFSLSLFRRH